MFKIKKVLKTNFGKKFYLEKNVNWNLTKSKLELKLN